MEIDRTIGKILQGYQPACVVITANELKIFDELKQPVTSKQVAKNRNLDPEACTRLLNALTSLEIITKKNIIPIIIGDIIEPRSMPNPNHNLFRGFRTVGARKLTRKSIRVRQLNTKS